MVRTRSAAAVAAAASVAAMVGSAGTAAAGRGASGSRARRRGGRALALAAVAAAAGLLPVAAQGALTHRYSFNIDGQAEDSVGGAHGVLVNGATVTGGRLILANNGTNADPLTGQYVDLPNNIAQTPDLTVEFWTTWNGPSGQNWQRFFDFGTNQGGERLPGEGGTFNGTEWIYLSPRKAFGGLGAESSNGIESDWADASGGEFAIGSEHHLALVFSSVERRMRIYQDGVEMGYMNLSDPATYDPSSIDMVNVWIGRSQWPDAFYNGSFDEFRIYDTALSAAQISASYSFGPDNLQPTEVKWNVASGDWGNASNWDPALVPFLAIDAIVENGGTASVTSYQQAATARLRSGAIAIDAGGTLEATVALAPATEADAVALTVNAGGTLRTGGIIVAAGTPAASKVIAIDGGTVQTTASFTVGPDVTTTVGAGGATFDVQSSTTVTWQPPLTPASPGATLDKVGQGTLVLSAGGYEGPVNVRGGTLAAAGDVGVAGTPMILGDVNAIGGFEATLRLTAPATVRSPIVVGPGSGVDAYVLEVAGDHAVAVPEQVTLQGPLTVRTSATTGTTSLTFDSIRSEAFSPNTLKFDNAGTVVVGAVGAPLTPAIVEAPGSAPLSVVQSGPGVTFFLSPNLYTGTTEINNGVLVFASPASVGGSGQSVTIAAGGVAALGPGFDHANITGTFLNRVTFGSEGVFAITADSSEAFDFTSGAIPPSLFLGAAGLPGDPPVDYSGTITPSGGTYRLGGGGGAALNVLSTLSGPNALIVGGGGAGGTVVLNAANTYELGTTIQRGATLSISNANQLGSGPINFIDDGTLQLTGTATVNQSAFLTLGAVTFDTASPTASITLAGGSAPPPTQGGQFNKIGPGSLTLASVPQTFVTYDLVDRPFLLHGGTTTISGSAFTTTTGWISVGVVDGEEAALDVREDAQLTTTGDFNVSDLGTSVGRLFIRDNATITARTVYVGKNVSTQGSVRQTGGQLLSGTGPGEWRIGGSFGTNDAQSVGAYTMTGGTLQTTGNLQVGAWGRGALTVQGGLVSVAEHPAAGRFAGSYGVITIEGTGRFEQTRADRFPIVGEEGTGIMNVGESGGTAGGTFQSASPLRLGLAAAGSGQLNVRPGGTVAVPGILGGPGGSEVNFHGGRLQATVAGATLLAGVKNVVVHAGGAVIDTNGMDVTLGQALGAPTGSGLASVEVTSGGAGYVAHPVVEITGGGGTGASAVAVLDGAGVVTGIRITNPGTGYTSEPSVTIKGGGSTSPATVGTVAIAPNANTGGLTKVGAGVLTLAAPGNSYGGPTVISEGTLRLAAAPTAQPVVWDADTIEGAAGSPVPAWATTAGDRPATTAPGRNPPTLAAGAINGNNAVQFVASSNQALLVAGADSPIGGASDYTVAVVFRTAFPGLGGAAQWWQNTGLVDAEEGGATQDWGMGINSTGQVAAGSGNPDVTAYSQEGLADDAPHVAILSKVGSVVTLTVDGVVRSVGGAATTPRNASPIAFGMLQTGLNLFTGQIAEVQMFNQGLAQADVAGLGNALAAEYGLPPTLFGSSDILPVTSAVSIAAGATLDINGRTARVGSVSGDAGSSVQLGAGTLVAGHDDGTAAFAGTISGTGGVTKVGSGTWTLSGPNDYTGPTRVAGGVLRAADAASIASSSRVFIDSGTLALAGGANPAATLASVVDEVKLTRNGGAGGDGAWDGPGRYASDAARAAAAAGRRHTALAVVLNDDGTGAPVNAALSTVATDVLVRYTYTGDTDLDGSVGPDDYLRTDAGFMSRLTAAPDRTGWFNGDFNYDGRIDAADYYLIDAGFALQGGSLAAGAPAGLSGATSAAVPEPASVLGLAAAGAVGLLGRRRRRGQR